MRVCRKCGAKVFSDAPEGLCTGCVLETALGIFPDTVAGAARSRPGEAAAADGERSGITERLTARDAKQKPRAWES